MALTFTPQKRARMIELHAQGMSCRQIAAALGFAAPTISKHAKRAGLTFDRSQTDFATRAHTVDLASMRVSLAQKMTLMASDLIDSADKPFLVYNFGGKDNTYEEHLLPSAPVDAKRTIMTAAGIAFDKATRIVENSDTGLEEALGVADTLAAGFAEIARIARATQETITDES